MGTSILSNHVPCWCFKIFWLSNQPLASLLCGPTVWWLALSSSVISPSSAFVWEWADKPHFSGFVALALRLMWFLTREGVSLSPPIDMLTLFCTITDRDNRQRFAAASKITSSDLHVGKWEIWAVTSHSVHIPRYQSSWSQKLSNWITIKGIYNSIQFIHHFASMRYFTKYNVACPFKKQIFLQRLKSHGPKVSYIRHSEINRTIQ